jgi:hypothetical protein
MSKLYSVDLLRLAELVGCSDEQLREHLIASGPTLPSAFAELDSRRVRRCLSITPGPGRWSTAANPETDRDSLRLPRCTSFQSVPPSRARSS